MDFFLNENPWLHPCIVFVTTVLVKMLQCLHSYNTSYIRMLHSNDITILQY